LLKLKIEFFPNEKDKYQNVIRIYGTEESLKLLNDNKIGQYFIDCTYKCVPHSLNPINVLIILIAYNHINKKFELCLIASFTNEDKETFKQFYSILKNKYNFNPKRITCDFAISNLQTLNSIFGEDNIIIITCFFHFLQCWWNKAGKLVLRKKSIVQKTRNLIFNLKLIPFMNLEKAREFYLLVKAHFNQDEFNKFYDYFELTWLILEEKDDVKFNFNILSYCLLEEYIFITNNYCESLNKLINNFIQINAKVGIDRLETIIKTLFIRLE